MINVKSDSVSYIVGKRKSGKSYLAEWLGKNFERIVVYDSATHQHANMGAVVGDIQQLRTALNNGTQKIVFQSFFDNKELFNHVCKVVWEFGNIMFMVEELGNYCSSYECVEFFDLITRVGRNRGIGIIGINQRPKRIWGNFVSVIDNWFIFKLDLPTDIKFIAEYIGDNEAENLKSMQNRFFIYKDNDNTTLFSPIQTL